MKLGKKIYNVYFYLVVNKLAASPIMPQTLRNFILNKCGIHSKGFVSPLVYFGSNNTTIGFKSFINIKCFFDENGQIIIGDYCHIGQYVKFCTSTHEIGSIIRAGKPVHGTITIQDNCWIGINTTILPNITIEKGCIIAAGSVVIKDCFANGLYAGVPAKRIKDI